MKKYDYVFVLDYNSLLNSKFFSIYDIETSDIRVVTSEMFKLNKMIRVEEDLVKRQKYIDVVTKINEFAENKQILFLDGKNEEAINCKLLEVVSKNYYLKNILIISNEIEKVEMFLPLIPVYESFGKTLDVGYIEAMLGFYEFKDIENALNCLSKECYDDVDDYDDIDEE